MFSFRQILKIGTRLSVKRDLSSLHQVTLKNIANLNALQRTLVRTNTTVCESQLKECVEKKHQIAKIEAKLKLFFTCKKCNTRNGKVISKLGYEKGVVIARCDGCKNNHLIADNLGWFSEPNTRYNIEKIMAAKGEHVRRIRNDVDGYIEAVAYAELALHQTPPNSTDSPETAKETTEIEDEKVKVPEKT